MQIKITGWKEGRDSDCEWAYSNEWLEGPLKVHLYYYFNAMVAVID